jgi:hypothetical protein
MTPEEIRKAEELANWDFIKDSTRPEEFRDHLARFVGGTTDRYARAKLEALLWADPATRDSIEALREFLCEFPAAEHAGEATAALEVQEKAAEAMRQAEENTRAETEAWARVAASTDLGEVQAFLRDWPDGAHAADAKRIQQLDTRRGMMKALVFFAVGLSMGLALTAWRSSAWARRNKRRAPIPTPGAAFAHPTRAVPALAAALFRVPLTPSRSYNVRYVTRHTGTPRDGWQHLHFVPPQR